MELRSVEAIVSALNQAEVRYVIVGGLAVNAHGYVRMTRDVDLVIELEEGNILRGLQALFAIGYQMAIPASPAEFANPDIRRQWRDERNMLVLKLWSDSHQRTPVDVFIYEPFDFSAEWEKLAKLELGDGLRAPVVSLESLLRMKREAGRPQDLIDIQELTRLP
ncbi:MAG TPA: hypothetical protein VIM44_04980 [Rariglobus sp.]